ncbi:hypothetical protein CsatB_004604 [Cannabis sativa]|uniref:WRKY domain-containing protein n=1 Tax=Cannabis sativa TaxID=3483 RepID=A0A7J6E8R1_CANSA|nr:hypothetical protein F8388_018039 [Cannabis sativa]
MDHHEDWDLLAVVRSGGSTNTTNNNFGYESPNMTNYDHQTTSFLVDNTKQNDNDNDDNDDEGDDLSIFNSFPHLFETTTHLDELEELYKPFYPVDLHPPMVDSHDHDLDLLPSDLNNHEPTTQKNKKKNLIMVQNTKQPAPTKYKKRKNQQKRVVKEVREDGLYSDKWAWRKYGQKPIKGSPYPRSYYRCSSSKGCLARKQVERSPSDPDIFIVTYTSEHSHAHPTRRNSLAGSTRTKFPPGTANTNTVLSNSINNNVVINNNRDLENNKSLNLDCNNGNSNSNGNGYLFPSLEDLEKGLLEEIDDEVESTNSKLEKILDCDQIDQLDYEFLDHDDHNFMDAWFTDQYSTTVTGAC